ncbi:hypothetical protein ILYODFUR_033191 [Ilyodon furcidens]|uniref:Uncharacterized protein n=1 Tax=Ilyodon furcidens TaxID=33524 RepID=A0ABV0SS98_9TELE
MPSICPALHPYPRGSSFRDSEFSTIGFLSLVFTFSGKEQVVHTKRETNIPTSNCDKRQQKHLQHQVQRTLRALMTAAPFVRSVLDSVELSSTADRPRELAESQ